MAIAVQLKSYVKNNNGSLARFLKSGFYALNGFSMPAIPFVYKALFILHNFFVKTWHNFTRVFYYTPMFKSRLNKAPTKLNLYSGMPLVLGNLNIEIGENSRISGQSTFSGRTASQNPLLIIGSNVDIGWQTTIAVGTKVVIGNDVRIAGRAFLAGYPGHPIDNAERAKGKACEDHQSGDIVLEHGVWLATGVTVSAGVTIGQGTIVAAGSVVTKSLPAFVMAGGVPAKVLRTIKLSS